MSRLSRFLIGLAGVVAAAGASEIKGRFIMDDVDRTCGANARHVRQAAQDGHLLTTALVNGYPGDDPSLQAYFGFGYVGKYARDFDDILFNVRLAGTMFPDPLHAIPGGAPQARLRCDASQKTCGGRVASEATMARTDSSVVPNIITFCPLAFAKVDSQTPILIHLGDPVAQTTKHGVDNLALFRSHEQTLLHEVMHLSSIGYRVPKYLEPARPTKNPSKRDNHPVMRAAGSVLT